MKALSVFAFALYACVMMVLASVSVTYAEEMAESSAGFEAARFVVCEGVTDREPVGETSTFPATAETACVFLEARDIQADTTVDIVWSRDGVEAGRVTLNLGAGGRWRTYSTKNIQGMPGNWHVEAQAADGAVLASADFKVE